MPDSVKDVVVLDAKPIEKRFSDFSRSVSSLIGESSFMFDSNIKVEMPYPFVGKCVLQSAFNLRNLDKEKVEKAVIKSAKDGESIRCYIHKFSLECYIMFSQPKVAPKSK